MKVIIAGGRYFKPTQADINKIFCLHIEHVFTEIVSGGAPGADAFGEVFADCNNIKKTRFLADWQRYGRGAGPIRNELMAQHADAVILFKGGDGTNNMRLNAQKYGLKVLYDQDLDDSRQEA